MIAHVEHPSIASDSEFLRAVVGEPAGDERLEIRAFDAEGRPKRHFARSSAEAVDFARSLRADHDVYYGPALRAPDADGDLKGDTEHVSRIQTVWCDLDFKCFPDGEAGARRALDRFPFPLSVVVHTGHGFHCYWLLDKPHCRNDEAGLRAVMRGIAAQLGEDAATPLDDVSDLPRVLRMPGSYNRKDEPLPVRVEVYEPERRYDLDAFRHAGIWTHADAPPPHRGSWGPLPRQVGEGRNVLLTRVAGGMRRLGLDEPAIVAGLLGVNGVAFDRPLSETEVRRIAHSIARYRPGGVSEKSVPPSHVLVEVA